MRRFLTGKELIREEARTSRQKQTAELNRLLRKREQRQEADIVAAAEAAKRRGFHEGEAQALKKIATTLGGVSS